MADQTQVKQEPDVGSPSTFMDEALDETPDLEFYDKLPDADAYSRMYLTRLPNYVWDVWSQLKDDEEVEIGTIRQWTDKDGNLKLQMRLHPDKKEHKNVPKEYNMDVSNHDVSNTFIFTEQDLPSFAVKNREKANALAEGIPGYALRKAQKQTEQSGERKRPTPYARRPIPKKTKIAGRIKHEVVCTPVQNAEADRFLAIRARAAQKIQKKTTILSGHPSQVASKPQGDWNEFLKTGEKQTKTKKMENKTARWPENQLLDAIARCFSEHKYWSIKAFRGRIRQPEAYLRETLDKIAVLHRTGTFANHWSLKTEYQGMVASLPKPADDAAVVKAEDLSDDEDDEDVQMEDVNF